MTTIYRKVKLRELGFTSSTPLSAILAQVSRSTCHLCVSTDLASIYYDFKGALPPNTCFWVAMEPVLIKGRSYIRRIETDGYGEAELVLYWAPLWFEFGPDCEFAFRLSEESK